METQVGVDLVVVFARFPCGNQAQWIVAEQAGAWHEIALHQFVEVRGERDLRPEALVLSWIHGGWGQ
jgi:hypothetical protein